MLVETLQFDVRLSGVRLQLQLAQKHLALAGLLVLKVILLNFRLMLSFFRFFHKLHQLLLLLFLYLFLVAQQHVILAQLRRAGCLAQVLPLVFLAEQILSAGDVLYINFLRFLSHYQLFKL